MRYHVNGATTVVLFECIFITESRRTIMVITIINAQRKKKIKDTTFDVDIEFYLKMIHLRLKST
jgi:hypothetical protein